MSLRQAFKLFDIRPSVYYYRAKPKTEDQVIRNKLGELASVNHRWGFWMMHYHLRNCNHLWNHKRVYRIYTEMGLNLRRKRKKRLPARIMEPLLQPIYPNITWSMDFMHDTLSNGINFRSLNIIDDYNREALCLTIDTSLTSKRVIRELDKLIAWRGQPTRIRVYNGPEFIAEVLNKWAGDRNIELKFIEKGKPHQNGFMERFNRSFREEVLDAYQFTRLNEAQLMANAWMWIYNNQRPHQSLGYKPPTVFLKEHQKTEAFPTMQKDEHIEWKSLVLTATN
ncbi:transposase [Candidatus Contendobacter odensis Run_B_J11]|uniref:Transposase n=2 Tax=Candidatus Contendibacter odensensis TaxID=1400860 RepID=A0A7U7GCD7_9GAMM|nr:transposase [Candidatus Contendobacter odensis Run_B_J11]